MTTNIRVTGPYAVRVTEQEKSGELGEYLTTGSVEYPAEEGGSRDITIHSTKRVIIEEYTPAPSEHDEQAEIDRVAASNEEVEKFNEEQEVAAHEEEKE